MKTYQWSITIILAVLVLVLASCGDPPTAVLPSESVRIGTYNFQFFPPAIRNTRDRCCDDISSRTEKLANRIIASDYDIFALNEVFDDDAKDRLIRELGEKYPHFVKEVRIRPDIIPQDSGLMLFSKWKFEELPNDTFQEGTDFDYARWRLRDRPVVDFATKIEASNDDRVAYIPFEACSRPDCRADKGAVYVRIRNPSSKRIYNIVFTHLQAGNDMNGRAEQFEQVEELITSTLDAGQLENEELFLLGDLNVNGDWQNDDGRPEWNRHFNSSSDGFFADNFENPDVDSGILHDVWEQETHHPAVPKDKWDRGLTVRSQGRNPQRLDYFLRNTPSVSYNEQLCIQHMTVAYNLRTGEPFSEGGMGLSGRQDLSDHYGVNADINRWAEHCSPHEAKVVNEVRRSVGLAERSNVVLEGTITYPGSMQWYLFNEVESGTYSIHVEGVGDLVDEDIDFRVYKSTNLSVPYQGEGYRGETTPFTYVEMTDPPDALVDSPPIPVERHVEGRRYSFLEPPFYIRVFVPGEDGRVNRTKTGNYELVVHKHTGITKEDAPDLAPNKWRNMTIESSRLSGRQERWFRIDTEGPDSERAQRLRFLLEALDGNPYRIEIVKGSDSMTETGTGLLTIERQDTDDNFTRLFLKVTLPSEASRLRFRVGWSTNLTVIHGTVTQGLDSEPIRVICRTQVNRPDAFGRDDWDVKFEAFIGEPDASNRIRGPLNLGTFDEGGEKNISDDMIAPIRFLPDELTVFRMTVDGRVRTTGRVQNLNRSDDGDGIHLPLPDFELDETMGTSRIIAPRSATLIQTPCNRRLRECGSYEIHFFVSHGFQEADSPGS